VTERRIVTIKIGSNSLVDEAGRLDRQFLAKIARQFAAIVKAGWQPVLVTSGAVAGGVARLGLKERPPGLPERQALAAIGQIGLVKLWEDAFAAVGLVAAQVLLTHDDFSVRHRYLNLIATFEALFTFGCVPVINENDTVATTEIRFGDIDRLAARVADMVQADALVLLSDIDGLYSADPKRDPTAAHIPGVEHMTDAIMAMGGEPPPGYSSGGMRTKLIAARIATGAGESQWITGETARRAGHALRGRNDAILVGVGTVLADNPQFTCRLPGMEAFSPLRIVLDSQLRFPLECTLAQTARLTPVWLVTLAEALEKAPQQRAQLEKHRFHSALH
jgi:glutamate 5-kinase